LKYRWGIIAISKVSSYESLACKTFLQLGADVAIVGSEKNGVRISSAAGANGKKNLDEAVKFLVKEIETFLKNLG